MTTLSDAVLGAGVVTASFFAAWAFAKAFALWRYRRSLGPTEGEGAARQDFDAALHERAQASRALTDARRREKDLLHALRLHRRKHDVHPVHPLIPVGQGPEVEEPEPPSDAELLLFAKAALDTDAKWEAWNRAEGDYYNAKLREDYHRRYPRATVAEIEILVGHTATEAGDGA